MFCAGGWVTFLRMWTILLCLILGTVLGIGLRRQQRLLEWADRGTVTAVYLLLFLLGASVGGNETAMESLATLGLQALLLALGSVIGSVLLAFLLYRWLFRLQA